MKITFYIQALFLISSINLMAQNSNDLRSAMLTASPWAVDQCYIDSMLYPKPINLVSHFYQDGSFSRAEKDTLVQGNIWSFIDNTQLSITHVDPQFNELYKIVVLEPNILILRNEVMDNQQQKKHTVEIRYKPYINN